MSEKITPEKMQHLAKLARIEITKDEESMLVSDAEEILAHFEELQEVDTLNVLPMNGGVNFQNAFRGDAVNLELNGKGKDNFPEIKNDYLKVPAVKQDNSDL